jgi:tetratricopeptide (TPR) repeat protein
MSSASRTISLLLLVVTAAPAAQQTSSQQQPVDLNQRDLEIERLPAEPEGSHPPVIPRGYALIIGIAKYEKLSPQDYLKFPESDAEAIYRVLISQQGGAFPPENVHKLIGAQATLQNLRHELGEWLPSVAQEQDRVVVYFAGHGFVMGGRGYIAPWDVDPASPETTAYPMAMLGKVLAQRVRAKWKVLLADACHSGKITAETTDEAVNAQLSQMPTGFLNLTATGSREKSFEDPKLSGGFGVFTYYVVRALQGDAETPPCDGVITAEEFVEYVRREVSNYVRKNGGGESQTPSDHEHDYDNNMTLGLNPRCHNSALPPPAPLGSIVIEANMDGVEVYLDENPVGTATKDKPLTLPGLSTGAHTVKGVREGYEPDVKQIMVVPGQEKSVALRIQYRRVHKPSAMDFVDRGRRLLFKQSSGVNPLDLLSTESGHQTRADLKKARGFFEDALKADPNYPTAAYDLALTCQLLSDSASDSDAAEMRSAFQQAVNLDPTYVEARVEYAGALIEDGDPDEAIRQLTEALRLDPRNDEACSRLSRAYLDKGESGLAVQYADQAIALDPSKYEAYLWRADALRRQAASEKDMLRRPDIYAQAVDSYRSFVSLTNFAGPRLHARLGYYVIGARAGYRPHPDRQESFAYQRNLAFAGLCDCEDKLGNLLRAADYCQRAIKYDPNEPFAYFFLGNVYRDKFNRTSKRGDLLLARANYLKMIQINPDLDMLSGNAKEYLRCIDQLLPRVK